jgi:hypothetical protein
MSTLPPHDETALKFAAIRWYVISLEKLANDLYITDREKFYEVDRILKHAFQELGKIRQSLKGVTMQEGCPPGYVYCDGICLPDCDPMMY